LFEVAGSLGLGAGQRVLDVGCRDGRHLTEITRRFACAAIGVEPVEANLDSARGFLGEALAQHPALISVVRGRVETLPFANGAFDLVWVRDVLIHVPELEQGLRECRRVLRPGGNILVFQMFATEWLEAKEAARLWPPLAAIPANADPDAFELAVAGAGLQIERREEIGSEWREFGEENGQPRTSLQLLHVARLLRDRGRLTSELGNGTYQMELANCLWGVYQMIGKLSPRIYLLR